MCCLEVRAQAMSQKGSRLSSVINTALLLFLLNCIPPGEGLGEPVAASLERPLLLSNGLKLGSGQD